MIFKKKNVFLIIIYTETVFASLSQKNYLNQSYDFYIINSVYKNKVYFKFCFFTTILNMVKSKKLILIILLNVFS